MLLTVAGLAASGIADAGRTCEPRPATVDAVRRELALAAAVARQLDELAEREGLRVAVIARAGQDLGRWGLRYSHLGIVYREAEATGGRAAWRVVHKLNECGTARSMLYRQGLAEFFGDGLYAHEAGLVALVPDFAAAVAPRLRDDALLAALHEPRYNMLAYPWSGHYQQSNQWAIETLALLADPTLAGRDGARDWLRARGYRATTLDIPPLARLSARIGSAHIAFDDHPFDRRMAGRIDTATVESVFAWLVSSGLGSPPRHLSATPATAPPNPAANAALVRRGPACMPT
jgi:hypothetical protein